MNIEAYARTDVGPTRGNNEDSMLVDLDHGIYLVADGMGGHAAGEIASRMAVESVHETIINAEDPDETRLVRSIDSFDASDTLRERMRYALNQASIKIRRAAQQDAEIGRMGTTVVMLVVEGGMAHLAHVGDSRAYVARDGKLTRLTRDHTVVQQEIDAGRLTPEQARMMPHRHLLTQSVGFGGPVEPDTSTRTIEPGDVFVLCSDGLTDALRDEDIALIIQQTPPDMLADALVEASIRAGTEDNITVVVVAATA
jgi:serine/threonine protein phosphatase PrpC